MEVLFSHGQIVATPTVNEFLKLSEVLDLVNKHTSGDFGTLPKDDIEMNKQAIKNNDDRVFSCYIVRGQKIYVITEWDRSYTTLLFAEEY